LRENLTSSSYGEGLETGRVFAEVPRQSLTRQVTFEEARRHLGFETQRRWSQKAIARTTPLILALFSIVTLLAMRLRNRQGTLPIRTAAWYAKPRPTFSDTLALVRAHLWRSTNLRTSQGGAQMTIIPRRLLRRLHEAACYAG
jgi:hypothetical protein